MLVLSFCFAFTRLGKFRVIESMYSYGNIFLLRFEFVGVKCYDKLAIGMKNMP